MPQPQTSQKRRIKKAKIRFISLCPRGANQLPTLYKEDGSFEIETLVKTDAEQGLITSIVYAPEFRDSQGDIASAQVIKDMAYEFLKNGGKIDIRHDGKDVGRDRASVVESFIVQKDDPRFADVTDYSGSPVDVTGAWATVIKLEDPALRSLYTEQGWQGVSMAGSAEVEIEREDTRSVADQLSDHYQQETDMALNDTDLEKIAGMISGAISEALKKDDSPAPEADPQPADNTPVFEGDPLNKEDVEAHREALRKHSLQQKLSKATTAAEVDEILKEISGETTPEADPQAADSDEVSRLKKELAKAQAASGAPVNTTTPTETDTQAALVKSMADYANRR